MRQQENIRGLMLAYERELASLELSCTYRLNQMVRVGGLVRKHEERGLTRLDDETVTEYLREVDEKFLDGRCAKNHYHRLRRTAEQFLSFADTGNVKLSNPQVGCREELTPVFSTIAEQFITTIPHPNTRNDARWVVYKYFAWLEAQSFEDLIGVNAKQIREYLLFAAKKYSMNSMRSVRLYLSKLYIFLYETGLADSAYQELLSFSVIHEVKIEPVLLKTDIARMLETIDRRTAAGKRAYAVMMLGTVLGLRACDVAKLKLSDIDWVNGEIKILQAKTATSLSLPLTRDVGEALRDYIVEARPKSQLSQVFLRLNAPHTELKTAVTIGEIFRDCCVKAGLPISKRFHSLRRSFATSMVNAGVSVYDVAQALGDTNIDSTKQYIAVDTEHLKLCALPFDGLTQEGGEAK